MNTESYKAEKLNFVSNLNGTTLNNLVSLISCFPMINFCCILIKVVFLFCLKYDKKTHLNHFFSFLIDYMFCIFPLLCMCTILADYSQYVQYILMTLVCCLYMFLSRTRKQFHRLNDAISDSNVLDNKLATKVNIEEKIIRLSVSTCRLWLYLLTCVTILGVDFKIFPRHLAKTEKFGISLMDLGVGFYIVCHSMKAIRNDHINQNIENVSQLPRKLFKTVKSSSILLFIGIMRLISLKATDYVEHVSEYGVHWNFLFTIVAVKLFACPLEILIKRSAMRSFVLAFTFALYYQYFLSYKNYTGYLLSDGPRSTSNLLHANKEGIYSLVGYLSIYLAFQAVCIRLTTVLNEDKKINKNLTDSFKTCLKCVVNLVIFLAFFYVMLEFTRIKNQNVSRRLCNLSFIFYTLTCSTMLLLFYLITNILTAKLLCDTHEVNKNEEVNNKKKELLLLDQLKQIFSFVEICDSKFVGVFIFLLSNLLTGLVNLNINTFLVTSGQSFIILTVYCFVSFAIPVLLFYGFFNKNEKLVIKEEKKIK